MQKVSKKDTTTKLSQRVCSAFQVYFEHIQYNIPDINLTRLWSLHPFYTPRKRRFSGVFRGCKMGTLAKNGLNKPLK